MANQKAIYVRILQAFLGIGTKMRVRRAVMHFRKPHFCRTGDAPASQGHGCRGGERAIKKSIQLIFFSPFFTYRRRPLVPGGLRPGPDPAAAVAPADAGAAAGGGLLQPGPGRPQRVAVVAEPGPERVPAHARRPGRRRGRRPGGGAQGGPSPPQAKIRECFCIPTTFRGKRPNPKFPVFFPKWGQSCIFIAPFQLRN